MEEEQNGKTISEYLEVLVRRKSLLLISFLTIGFLSFVLAMKLPPVYRSSATILIEDQQIPRSMVETTITDFADKRIELIRQRVMTRDRILSIIQKYNVYLDERNKLVPSELVKRFQEDAEIKMISADVLDPNRGVGKATIAFTISFSDRDPVLAQSVANELVSLFLDENTRVRAQRAAKTTDFLSAEAEKLRKEMDGFETRIMDYKAKHGKSLPEMLQINLSAMDRAIEALRQTDSDIRIAKDRIIYLTDSLRQAEDEVPAAQAGKPLNKDEQLRLLKSEFIRLSARYTPTHPDVLRVKRQIQSLDSSFNGEVDEAGARKELAEAENGLVELKKKYSETHPDVLKQEKRVAKLSEALSGIAATAANSEDDTHQGNTLYISLSGQLRATEHELEHLMELKDKYQQTIQELQENIDETPLVEKEYQDLMRMRQTSLNKYAELEAKYRGAKLAQTLEEEQKGETFTLIEPPIAPDKPEKPDRKKIIILGFGLGIGLGLGLTVLLELMHETIRGTKALERVTGMPPIVVIPYIETPQDRLAQKQRLKLIWIISAATFLLLIALAHFFVMPLELVWSITLMKLGRL
ncbi:GumC family protein [Methylomonas methanica]|uniref:Lipopolysaccharide biosynthesis protein n=1 Tax=Methylomonas methanica (strain DSM 25384 / MC09) TaxID=857087 RepID=G0A255_METMM|nr:LPS biosynthesis protein [Methylomonas methanica]AEG02598.1 lipopolysaccharide biosynthesis protein [Methylomonas methanica MC09]